MFLEPKPLPADWQERLFNDGYSDARHSRNRVRLDQAVAVGPVRGEYFLFRRIGHVDPAIDWTVGLGFTDLQGNEYRLVRANGPHGGHRNRLEDEALPIGCHVHFATERYLRARRCEEDGFAVPTEAYATLPEALQHLVSVTNLYVPGRLWTVDA